MGTITNIYEMTSFWLIGQHPSEQYKPNILPGNSYSFQSEMIKIYPGLANIDFIITGKDDLENRTVSYDIDVNII